MAREGRQLWYTISFSCQFTEQLMPQVTWLGGSAPGLDVHFFRIFCNRLGNLSKLIWELKFCVCLDAMKSQQDTEFTGCSGISALAYSGELLHLGMQKWKFFIMFLCSSSDNRDQCGCDIQYMVLEAASSWGVCFLAGPVGGSDTPW